jgi:hypothetical protein
MTLLDNLLGAVMAPVESLAPLRQVTQPAWLSSLCERQKHRRTTTTKGLGVSADADCALAELGVSAQGGH